MVQIYHQTHETQYLLISTNFFFVCLFSFKETSHIATTWQRLWIPHDYFVFACTTYIYTHIWLRQVLAAATATWDLWSSLMHVDFFFFILVCRIFSCGTQTLSSGMWDLVPWPGITLRPPELGVQTLSHWTTREAHNMCWFWCPNHFILGAVWS